MIDLNKLMDCFIDSQSELLEPVRSGIEDYRAERGKQAIYELPAIEALQRQIEAEPDHDKRAELVGVLEDRMAVLKNPIHPVHFQNRSTLHTRLNALFELVRPLVAEGRQFAARTRATVTEAEGMLSTTFGVAAFRTHLHGYIDRFEAIMDLWQGEMERLSSWNVVPRLPAFTAMLAPIPAGEPGVDLSADPRHRRAAMDVAQASADKAEADRKAGRLDNLKKKAEREASMTREQISAARSRARKNPFHNRLRPGGVQPEPDEDGAGEEVVNEAIK